MSNAISVHMLRTPSMRAARGRRNHDLRIGPQPAYVDASRSHLNRVLLEPPAPGDLRNRAIARRAVAAPKRALRSNASIAEHGVVSFGDEIQATIRENPILADRIYTAVVNALSKQFDLDVLGLVVHEDEAGPHAHVWLDAYDGQGRPASRSVGRSGSVVQDVAAREAQRHLPEIERGTPKRERIARGEGPRTTRHRTPRELHADLGLPPGASADDVQEAVGKLREARRELRAIQARIRDAETRERDLGAMREFAWIAEAITAGELQLDPGRTWARGHAMPEDAWPETKGRLEALELPEHLLAAVEQAARAMRQNEAFINIDVMLHCDWARLGTGKAWEKGAGADDRQWKALKTLLDSLDLPAPLWRRIEATAAAADRRRQAWAEAFVLPLVAAGAVVPDPGHPGRWKADPGVGGMAELPHELEVVFGKLSHDYWEWADDLSGLLAAPTPERAADFRARCRERVMKLAAEAARLDDAWAGPTGDAAAITLPEPAPRGGGADEL